MKNSAHLSTGDVLHCQGERLISKLIRLFTKSRFSHTAICLRIEGVLFVADSQRDGTHLRPFDDWMKKYSYKFEVMKLHTDTSGIYKASIKNRILDEIGTKSYDYWSLFWYHPRYILTGKWKGKRERKGADKFYCSEFVSYCLDYDEWFKHDPQSLFEVMTYDRRFRIYLPMGPVIK